MLVAKNLVCQKKTKSSNKLRKNDKLSRKQPHRRFYSMDRLANIKRTPVLFCCQKENRKSVENVLNDNRENNFIRVQKQAAK